MNKQIEGLDANGTRRVYGIGETRQQALNNCIDAAHKYLKERPDISALYLVDDNGKPVFDAATYSQWEIKA
jgi:hypothetical protein